MNIDILSLTITGAIISAAVTLIKKLFKTGTYANYAAVIGLSLIGGAAWFYSKDTHFWPVFTQVLVYANAVYAFVLSKFE